MATPKRELFKAPEVCEMAQLQPYVLRTWEAEFPSLGKSSGGGPRVYRRADVEMVLRIKQLVFGEGLTLAGARRRLEEQPGETSVAAGAVADVLGDMARSRLRQVRTGLEAIMRLLSRDADAQTELQLVAPPSGSLRSSTRPAASSTRAVSASRRPAKSAKAAAGKR